MTTAVILAAGLGTRLRPVTGDRPKALVVVGGRSLLDGLLETAAAAGCTRAIVVTGHYQEAIVHALANRALPLPTRCVYNKQFDACGNAWSLRVALAAIPTGDVLKLDGDLILDPAIAATLVGLRGTVLGIDRRVALDDEAMKVRVGPEGRVIALGKDIEAGAASGESIGAEKIAAGHVPRLIAAIDALVETLPKGYYEDAYQRLNAAGRWDLHALDVDSDRWAEIDAPEDLARGERVAALIRGVRPAAAD